MAKKDSFLTVFLWLEMMVCLVAFLFVLPVWINQYYSGSFGAMTLNDWFMVVLTIAVFLHGMAAILCLKNFLIEKWIHYLCLGVVLLMTSGLEVLSRNVTGTVALQYLYPLVGSFAFVIIIKFVRI